MPESAARSRRRNPPQVAGWREIISLPGLGAGPFIAKLDTGANSASLHAENIEVFLKDLRPHVRFDVPDNTEKSRILRCELPLKGSRRVKNTGGVAETRLVIETEIALGGHIWKAPITLSDRTDMGVPMLLGRTTMRGRFIVNPDRSFLLTEPESGPEPT